VEFPVDLPETLIVPADAIVDSGLRKTVFVDTGNGYFEPRLVETGPRVGDDVEVTNGLVPGERIVVSGTFFLDSESRMKAPAPRAKARATFEATVAALSAAPESGGAPALDPVCGMHVDAEEASAAGRTATHGDHVFHFCSDHCKKQFVADPSHYAKPGVAAP
jgi:YHS domain-containing protein